MREKNIAILAVQETHLTDELADQFNTLFRNRLSLAFSPDPNTRNARGIAIVLSKNAIKTENVKTTVIIPGRAMSATIPWQDDQSINVLAVYAPNAPSETKEFWNKISSTIRSNPNLKPDITLGDFNLVEDAIDRLPCKADDHGAVETLREFKIAHNLIDGWRTAHPDEKGYTWSRESDRTQSRIDRIYVKEEFFSDCKKWDITPAPIPTDHDMVSAIISTPSTPVIGKGRWAIPKRLTKNKEVKHELQRLRKILENEVTNVGIWTNRRNLQTLLKDFKTGVIKFMRNHERKTQPMIRTKIDRLAKKLEETCNDPELPEDEIKIASVQLKREIQSLIRETHQRNREKVAAIDAAEGECIGKTWSNRFKEAKPRDTINTSKSHAQKKRRETQKRWQKLRGITTMRFNPTTETQGPPPTNRKLKKSWDQSEPDSP